MEKVRWVEEIAVRAVAELRPRADNPRRHSRRQLRKLKRSLRAFGFLVPVLIDASGAVIAGHARLEAAQQLGLERVPTITVDHLVEAEIRAFVLADNRLAEDAEWDEKALATYFENFLEIDSGDLVFDVTLTGFETPEIDLLLGAGSEDEPDLLDETPAVDELQVPVSRTGDVWELGSHRIHCGDARDPVSFDRLLGRLRAQLVFVDPPYNVKIPGHVGGSGRVRHDNFAMACGELSPEEFATLLKLWFSHLCQYSDRGSIHYCCMDWRHSAEIVAAGQHAYPECKAVCVWVKTNGGMGSLYRSQHEFIWVFKNGTEPHTNNIELGRHGRNRTNVWRYAGVNTFRRGRNEDLAMHPTVKPVAMVADAIKDCSNRGDIILDCFGGSGTTLIAAEKTGRRGYLIELDPKYVDVTIERYEKLFGGEARHAETGLSYLQTRDQRSRGEVAVDASEALTNGGQ